MQLRLYSTLISWRLHRVACRVIAAVDGRVEVSLIISVLSKHPSPQFIHLCDMGFRVTDRADNSSTAADLLSLNSMVVPEWNHLQHEMRPRSCVSPFQPNYQCFCYHWGHVELPLLLLSGPTASQTCLSWIVWWFVPVSVIKFVSAMLSSSR